MTEDPRARIESSMEEALEALRTEEQELSQRLEQVRDDRRHIERARASLRRENARGKPKSTETRCAECDRIFASPQGLTTHNSRKHGPGWDTAGNFRKPSSLTFTELAENFNGRNPG